MGRIPSRMKYHPSIEEADVVLVDPWDWQDEKATIERRIEMQDADQLGARGTSTDRADDGLPVFPLKNSVTMANANRDFRDYLRLAVRTSRNRNTRCPVRCYGTGRLWDRGSQLLSTSFRRTPALLAPEITDSVLCWGLL